MDEEAKNKTKLAWIQGKRGKRGKQGKSGGLELQHKWRWRLLVVWIVIFSALVAYSVRENRERSREGIEAKIVLCKYNANLKKRVTRSEEFLKNNRDPILLGNVPRTLIEQGVKEDKETLKAGRTLRCPPEKKP